MTAREVRLLGREEVATGTMAFRFEKPPGFQFKPGQAVDLTLDSTGLDPEQDRKHAFSIASAPFEDELVIATRMRDSTFKRALAALPIGGKAIVEGPFGSLALHKDAARGALLIAGGIGITPFRSMLRQADHDRAERRLVLLCSNHRPEDAPFLPELQRLEKENPGFRLVATMTDMARSASAWGGETRMIDAGLLASVAGGLQAPIHYVVGPPAMVAGVRDALAVAGVEDDDVRTEEFYGY
jgi:ferredoxin-NADP reductase